MTALNKKPSKAKVKARTHEGAPAKIIDAEAQLRRAVMSCMLWEREFYESGETIADRISLLIPSVKAEIVFEIAAEAREKMKLRHIPLLLARVMAGLKTHSHVVAATLERVIQRPDELSEFLAIYWKDGKCPLSAQVKKGLALAFQKFNEYSLAKYNRDGAIKLRDVLLLCHAKPKDLDQAKLWKRLIENKLETPDTWEVELSASKDKKASWARLLTEGKLGALALLRNLRNFAQAGVDKKTIRAAIKACDPARVLPFRFIAAARFAPEMEPELEEALFKCVSGMEKMPGNTVVLVDVSGSMDAAISQKSDMQRIDAACGLAMVLREVCETCEIFSFSANVVQVPSRRGFALRDAILKSQSHGSTDLGSAVKRANLADPDRIVVITDEQSQTPVGGPKGRGYMINVASAKNGVGYGPWVHLDGFSEAVVSYISAIEDFENEKQ